MPGPPDRLHTKNTGITVHRADCKASRNRAATRRIVEASWEASSTKPPSECPWASACALGPDEHPPPLNIDIERADYHGRGGAGDFRFTAHLRKSTISRIVRALNTVNGVQEIVEPEARAPNPGSRWRADMDVSRSRRVLPAGDQPAAIDALVRGLGRPRAPGPAWRHQPASLHRRQRHRADPAAALVRHNKILAAQLYGEFKTLFTTTRWVFVSYYDYYQRRPYVPASDTFIEGRIDNGEIDRCATRTRALLTRRDASSWRASRVSTASAPRRSTARCAWAEPGQMKDRDELLAGLVEMQYSRNDVDFRGTFGSAATPVDIFPATRRSRGRVNSLATRSRTSSRSIRCWHGTPQTGARPFTPPRTSHAYLEAPSRASRPSWRSAWAN